MLRTSLLRAVPRQTARATGLGLGMRIEAMQRTFATKTISNQTGALLRHKNSARSQILRNTTRAKPSGGRRPFSNTSTRRDAPKSDGANAKGPAIEAEPAGLSARLKKLSREYGWSAVGVYFALSVLDFPFCFLLVRIVGTDRIGALEDWIMTYVKKAIPDSIEEKWHNYRKSLKKAEVENLGSDDISEHIEMAGWGVEEAERRNKGPGASLGTQLALAYAIHKSFIFLRVPLTAAVTPKVVKKLRSWGWNIGKRRPKPASSTTTATTTSPTPKP